MGKKISPDISAELKMLETPILEEDKSNHAVVVPARNGGLKHSDIDLESNHTGHSIASQIFLRRQFRRNVAFGAAAAIGFLLVLFAIVLGAIVILSKYVQYPDIIMTGRMNGNISAELGNFGHVVLYPDLLVNLKAKF